MSEYINLDLDFFDHIKTVRLVGRLGKGSEILPIKLWCYCGKYHADSGRLSDYLPTEIETSILKWWGKPGEAMTALLDCGFLEKESTGFLVHDWKAMNGHIQAFKKRARKAAKVRWEKMSVINKTVHGTVNKHANAKPMLEQCPSNAPPTDRPTYQQKKELYAFFERVWHMYPAKAGKKEAEKHFFASVHNAEDYKQLEKAMTIYLASKRVKNGFIQDGSTWFNNWRDWLNYTEPEVRKREEILAQFPNE